MPRIRKHKRNQIDKDQIIKIREQRIQKTKRKIALLLSGLIISCIVLVFNIGESIYPSWISMNRMQIIGILIFFIIVTIVSSPLIVEANSNYRPFSGSSKNPYIDL